MGYLFCRKIDLEEPYQAIKFASKERLLQVSHNQVQGLYWTRSSQTLYHGQWQMGGYGLA